jgi:hypothetical protein
MIRTLPFRTGEMPDNGTSPLNWIASIGPSLQTAFNWGDIGKAFLQQERRRTGTGLLRWSSAIGDDPIAGVKFILTRCQLVQWDRKCTRNMALLVGCTVTHIYKHSGTVIIRFFCI